MEAKETILFRLNHSQGSTAHQELADDRKLQVGSGERGDKMRTYRFQDDMVKDHQTGRSAKCTKVLSGYFDLLWD